MALKRTGFKKKTKEQIAVLREEKRQKQQSTMSKPKTAKKGKNKPKKAKPKTQAWLKKELDRVFSIYIRQKFSDSDGNNTCYTCGKAGTIKTMQNGHFVSRQYLATRWDENNCRIQCCGCNLFGNGKPLDFEERLKKELGGDFVEEMKQTRHQSLKLDRNWYKAEIEKYKLLIT